MSREDLRERLKHGRLFCDGGFGTFLQQRGLRPGELPETWNLTHPDAVREGHEMFFRAGADIVNTNTFGANRLKYPEDLEEIVTQGVILAKEGRKAAGREEDAYVALDLGPTGKLLSPLGPLGFEEAVELFSEVVRIGAGAGADLVMIETMNDTRELKAAVLAARSVQGLPVFATTTYDEKGKLLTGGDVPSVVALLTALRVDALGVNCSLGPRQMLPVARRLLMESPLPVIVNPNAGLPREEAGRTVFDVGPEEFGEVQAALAAEGVRVLGGCCGTTADHIREVTTRCRALPLPVREDGTKTYVTSFSRAVEIGERTVVVGERINPTGKKKLKEALLARDVEYVLREAMRQEDEGAEILDVNVGVPGIDEPALLKEVVEALQSTTSLPLQIDTSDPTALAAALRAYNGKAMVNSVNGKRESLEAVLPVVAEYGGVLVCLLLDEDGIPDSAEGRLRVAEKIRRAARDYGIREEDLVYDCLAMAVSSDERSARTTLTTLERVRRELSGRTILGVSNVSFGLPARPLLNGAFLSMAMERGLSCAIMNPGNPQMMQAYRSSLALLGMDPHAGAYIGAFQDWKPTAPLSGTAGGEKKEEVAGTLRDCVLRGLEKDAAEKAREELVCRPPLELIEEILVPALDEVGKGFEKGTIFLPQLLMSAEAAKCAFAVIKEAMAGGPQETKGRVLLATVKGDIHDIGKNIVKVMLENYGYEVLDLGKDVPPEEVVETVQRERIRLVGLSALMTTTVTFMEETIALLRQETPGVKVVVGGAVLTPEYAERIGADYYAKDAMATVRCAEEVFGA